MKNYKISLEVLTPVYIGNGSDISKKDYDLKGSKAYIYDPIKLHGLFGNLYEDFLMDRKTLTDFLGNNPIRVNKDLGSALKYQVDLGDRSIRKSDNIKEFIKDAYGYPYIPGSSLKGAIRTAILAYEIKKSGPNKYGKYRSENLSRATRSNYMEEEAFGRIIHSKFKKLRISDSKPLPKDSLVLSKKIDIFKDSNSNNKLNLSRESLKPGTIVEFQLSILDNEEIFTPENIMMALKEFIHEYRKRFLSKFKSYDESYLNEDIIYIGGGTGFLTKTVNYALYGDKALTTTANFLNEQFRKHDHRKDIALGISPRAKKCTKINNKTVEMGICKIRID